MTSNNAKSQGARRIIQTSIYASSDILQLAVEAAQREETNRSAILRRWMRAGASAESAI